MSEDRMRNLEVIILGPPTLEDKLRAYIDARDGHKALNAKEDDAMIRDAITAEIERRDGQHEDNQTQFRQLFRLVWIGVGIVITLQVVLLTVVALYKH
jgi:hypothetical protein